MKSHSYTRLAISSLIREVNFTLQLGGENDRTDLNSFDEGVELAIQNKNGSGEWVPLMFYTTQTKRKNGIIIGNISESSNQVNIRGHSVSYVRANNNERRRYSVKVCGELICESNASSNWIKFRWLQSVYQGIDQNRDRVFLDDVQISAHWSQHIIQLLGDDFNNQTAIE